MGAPKHQGRRRFREDLADDRDDEHVAAWLAGVQASVIAMACAWALATGVTRWLGSSIPAELACVVAEMIGVPLAGVAAFFGYRAALEALFAWVAGLLAEDSAAGAARPDARRLLIALAATAAGAAAALLVAWLFEAPLARAVAYLLPGLSIWASGLWLALVIQRTRWWWSIRTDGRWELGFWDGMLFCLALLDVGWTTVAALMALVWPDKVTTVPITGALFPVAVAMCVWIWRTLVSSGPLIARAGADVVACLLLSGVLVLFAAWFATMTRMPGPVVAALRLETQAIGSEAEPPGWVWVAVFAVLATANVAAIRLSGRVAAAGEWLRRRHLGSASWTLARVVPATAVARRLSSGLHFALLLAVLLGVAAPAALNRAVSSQVADRYLVAYQRDLTARAATAAYGEIATEVAKARPRERTALRADLVLMLLTPPDGLALSDPAEADYARRLGAERASDLAGAGTGAGEGDQAETAAAKAGLDGPIRDATDLAEREAALEDEAAAESRDSQRAEQAGQSATTALSSLLSIPPGNAAMQVIAEYLSGMVEEGPLEEYLAKGASTVGGKAGGEAGGKEEAAAEAALAPDEEEVTRAAAEEETAIEDGTVPAAANPPAGKAGPPAEYENEEPPSDGEDGDQEEGP